MVVTPGRRKTDYDIIISGGGCAGLSLAWHLYRFGPADQRILLIEPETAPQSSRTWCYWNLPAVPFNHLRRHSWHAIRVRTHDREVSRNVAPGPGYHAIDSSAYRDWIYKELGNHPYLTITRTETRQWQEHSDHVSVETPAGLVTAGLLFQNHYTPADVFAESRFGLKQHFTGWEIEVNRPVFDPDTATFMDFSVPQEHGLAFMYVLPWSAEQALLEFTFFSSEVLSDGVYESGIREYLERNYGIGDGDYRIIRREQGVIPMVENARQPGTRRIRPIGIVSGAAKPSTGYAFTRIQKQSRFLAESMKNHPWPPFYSPSPYRFRVYDIIMLHIMKHKPATAIQAFEMLFRKVPAARLFRFLDEETSYREELSILNSVPKRRFLTALLKESGLLFQEIVRK